MGWFDSIFGARNKQTPAAAPPTPAPAPGASPAPPAAPGAAQAPKPGAGGMSASLAAEEARIKHEEADLLAGAYTGGHSGTRDPAAAAALQEQKKALEERMQADKALAGRFQVVDKKGPNDPPNALTKDEYARIVQQYADINAGRSDIQFNTAGMTPADAKKFKDGAMNDVANILQTQSGRDTVGQLHDNVLKDASGKPIDPATGQPLAPGQAPTHRTTTLGQASDPKKANETAANWNDGANPAKGTNAKVDYVPGASVNTTRSDVVLLHEMRHAVFDTMGKTDIGKVPMTSPVAADRGKFGQWEHQAVGLGDYANLPQSENAYRRERAAIGAANGPGVLPGDVNMPQRTSYNVLP